MKKDFKILVKKKNVKQKSRIKLEKWTKETQSFFHKNKSIVSFCLKIIFFIFFY